MNIYARAIIDNLKDQPNGIIADANTFKWLRTQQYDLIESNHLGGGNVLSLIGLFSVLNYYAKIYKILISGKLPKSNKNINPEEAKNYFNEEDAFKRLLFNYPTKLITPQQDNDTATLIWRTYRDSLSHTAHILPGNQALVLVMKAKNIPKDTIESFIKNSKASSFTIFESKATLCYVDKLISDVEGIRDWIINQLESDKFQKKILR
jgi:hypothetical protein